MVTIKDIAKIAGVSHTTVSRALNNSSLIRPETKEKIHKIAEELNYVPNVNAKSLVTQRSFMIGLFFSSLEHGTSDSFLVEVIKGINSVLPDQYNLSVKGIDTLKNFDFLSLQRFDGVIVMSQTDQDDQFITALQTAAIPFVILNRQADPKDFVSVTSNDRQGVLQGMEYAIARGIREIGFIEGKKGFRSTIERKKGYLDSLAAHMIPFRPEWVAVGDYSIESGRIACEKLLQLSQVPKLIFCSNDDMAIGALKACHAHGLHVPEDISLMGFDGIPFTHYTSPALTTIRKPVMKISQVGTQALLHLIQKEVVQEKQILIDTSLEIRDSVI